MNRQSGLSLIELMIVLVIIGILSSLSYPNYVNYSRKTKRLEGRLALLDLAGQMEHYALNRVDNYQNASLDTLGMNENTLNKYYRLSILEANESGYTISAQPNFSDRQCTQLYLNHLGERNYQGSGTQCDCWGTG